MAGELKEQTRKLCSQLQDKPDMDGNQKEIKQHKRLLCDWITDLKTDLRNLTYQQFANRIKTALESMNRFAELRDREREYNMKIKQISEDQQQAIDDYTRDTDEYKQQIAEKKQTLAETEVEHRLKTQLLERQIEGQQSCLDRQYLREETHLLDRIKYLESQLKTEAVVSKTIREHLQAQASQLVAKGHAVDDKKDRQSEAMTATNQELL